MLILLVAGANGMTNPSDFYAVVLGSENPDELKEHDLGSRLLMMGPIETLTPVEALLIGRFAMRDRRGELRQQQVEETRGLFDLPNTTPKAVAFRFNEIETEGDERYLAEWHRTLDEMSFEGREAIGLLASGA